MPKVRKSSEIGLDQKTLISSFAQVLTDIAKNKFLEGRLDTTLACAPIFFWDFLFIFSWDNLYTKFIILDIKFCFTCSELKLHGNTVNRKNIIPLILGNFKQGD